jgi:hypothetical protein
MDGGVGGGFLDRVLFLLLFGVPLGALLAGFCVVVAADRKARTDWLALAVSLLALGVNVSVCCLLFPELGRRWFLGSWWGRVALLSLIGSGLAVWLCLRARYFSPSAVDERRKPS